MLFRERAISRFRIRQRSRRWEPAERLAHQPLHARGARDDPRELRKQGRRSGLGHLPSSIGRGDAIALDERATERLVEEGAGLLFLPRSNVESHPKIAARGALITNDEVDPERVPAEACVEA